MISRGPNRGESWTPFAVVEFVMREAALFAACGFLLLGASDLAVDLIWIGLRLTKRAGARRRRPGGRSARAAGDLHPRLGRGGGDRADAGACPRRLRRGGLCSLCRLLSQRRGDDRGGARGGRRPRLRLVIGPAPGPTSKADCLNRLWERMLEDEAADGIALQGGGASRRRGRRPFGRAVPVRLAGRAIRSGAAAGAAADRRRIPLRRRPLCRRVLRGARQGAGGPLRDRRQPAFGRGRLRDQPGRAGGGGDGAGDAVRSRQPDRGLRARPSAADDGPPRDLRPGSARAASGRSSPPANISRRRSTRRWRRRRDG